VLRDAMCVRVCTYGVGARGHVCICVFYARRPLLMAVCMCVIHVYIYMCTFTCVHVCIHVYAIVYLMLCACVHVCIRFASAAPADGTVFPNKENTFCSKRTHSWDSVS